MTRDSKSSHTRAVMFSRRPLPGRHSLNGSLSTLLPQVALPGPEKRRAIPWEACVSLALLTLTAGTAD
jgi:hypothetical protein